METTTITKNQEIEEKDLSEITILEHFYKWEKERPNEVFMRQPEGETWKTFTWKQIGEEARKAAAAIKEMDFPPKSNIALVSKNCVHWIVTDLAIMMAGHTPVPFFPTLNAEQLNLVLTHSESTMVFVGKLDDWNIMKDGIPKGMPIVSFPQYASSVKIDGEGVTTWDSFTKDQIPLKESYVPDLDDLFTICYTSGTTGVPKGVMLTYRALAHVQKLVENDPRFEIGGLRFFSYLPMNHIAERVIVEAGAILGAGEISFAQSLETFAQNLADTQPTHFFAVPRIWTKFQLGVLNKMPQKKLDTLLKIPILSGIVKKKILKGLGLSKAYYVLTGAAPIPASLLEWYKKIGLVIREGYGMSENCAACTITPEDKIRPGKVGLPQPGAEIRIEDGTGEIMMRAPWVMKGYYKNPEKTAEVLTDEGWLRTGDKGHIDEEGYLVITGRVKDIFKTAKGEYVAPFTLETKFATNNHIEQICVTGPQLPQPIALLVPSEDGIKLSKEELRDSLLASLQQANAEVFNYEQIRKIIVTKEPWTVDNGLLTATLKTRRQALDDKYQANFQKWYEESDTIIWE